LIHVRAASPQATVLQWLLDQRGRPRQLEELVKSVAMSRTTFALRFKTVAGVTPLTYLLN
jgi:transcriptional regulator GlxA family with amidase domain